MEGNIIQLFYTLQLNEFNVILLFYLRIQMMISFDNMFQQVVTELFFNAY